MATPLQSYEPVELIEPPVSDDGLRLPDVSSRTLGGALAVLLAILLAWAIAMTVLYADTQNGGHHNTLRNNVCTDVPKHAKIDAESGCVFSSNKMLEARAAILNYTAEWHFCAYWIFGDLNWEWFGGGNHWTTWDTTADTNPLIAAFDVVNASIQAALADPHTSFVESAELRRQLGELELLPQLARLHHYHVMTFDYQWIWSNMAPPECISIHAEVLPFFAAEPDYGAKSLRFMNNSLNALLEMNDYYPTAIAEGFLSFNDSAAGTWFNVWQFGLLPGTTQPICDAMTDVADQTACNDLVVAIDAAAATLIDIMENQWIPACNAGFNYGDTGIAALPNGQDAAAVWTTYFYDDVPIPEQRLSIARDDAEAEAYIVDLLADMYPGTTFAQWKVRLNDLNDAGIWHCASDVADFVPQMAVAYANSTKFAQQAYGYGSFNFPKPLFSAGLTAGGFFSAGPWDDIAMVFRASSTISYGLALNGPLLCFPRFNYGLVDHEGPIGHARHVEILIATKCPGDPIGWNGGMLYSYIEGIAAYGSSVAMFDTTMITDCPDCALSEPRFVNYVAAGAMYDFAYYGNLTFAQCQVMTLASGVAPTPSLAYRNCYRSMVSMQRTSYNPSARRLRAMRVAAESALGSEFDLIHWHKFIFRVGPLPWEDIEQLNEVYIQWRLGNEDAVDMPGYSYVVCQLFGNTWATFNAAGHLPIIDDVLDSNPTHVNAAAVDALMVSAETNPTLAAILEKIEQRKQMFGIY